MASARFESSEEVSEPPDQQEDSEADLDTIQRELEGLNSSSDTINTLERELMQKRQKYSKDYAIFKELLEGMKKKDSSSIAKCEPLIKAKKKMTEMQEILNNTVARYDKANSQHSAAKELIQVAEHQLATGTDGVTMDQAWQETLNHATEKVVETALEKSRAEQDHKMAADEYAKARAEYNELWKKLQKFFVKAKIYYAECHKCNNILKLQKDKIEDLERQVKEAKLSYSRALKSLDTLSCSIHEKRRATVTSRLKHITDANQPDYHGSNDKLSYAGEFEASMLSAVPSSSCLLGDEVSAHNHDHQGSLPNSSSSGSVMGGLVANHLDAALCSADISDHNSRPSTPPGHHDNGRPGTPAGHHDNNHPGTTLDGHPSSLPGGCGVSPTLLSTPLVIISHDQSSTLQDHSSSTPVCLNPTVSDGLTLDRPNSPSHQQATPDTHGHQDLVTSHPAHTPHEDLVIPTQSSSQPGDSKGV